MASAYFVVSNATANLISLDGGDFRQSIPASGTLNIYSNDLVGNKALCDQLSTLVTAGSISVTRSGNSVTAADLTSFGFGADMLSSQYDQDQNEVADDSENLSIQSPTDVVVGDSPYSVTTETVFHVDTSGGAVELDLPAAASSSGQVITVLDVGGNAGSSAITLDGSAAETIDGSATLVINSDYGSVTIECDGASWFTRAFSQADLAESIISGSSIVTAADLIKAQTGYVASITEVDDSLSPYTVLVSDEIIMCDSALGTISLVLPDPATVTNKTIVVKDAVGDFSTNEVTLTSAAGTIDGSASLVMTGAYDSIRLLSNGTNWLSVEKTRNKVGTQSHTQAVSATSTDFQFVAPGPGRITFMACFAGSACAAGESVECDVLITGTSCLTAAATITDASTTDNVLGTIDTALNSFVQGDRIAFDRVYVPGGAPTSSDIVISIVYELD